MLLSCKTGEAYEWRKWVNQIPFIEFPAGWRVQVIPPFTGAVARFRVLLPESGDGDYISIYLDCYEELGFFGEPYWEVYPYQGDTGRCRMADTAKLIEMIADRSPGAE